MAFKLETGGGTAGANAYVDDAFVTDYLTDRGRETENNWNGLATSAQQQNIIKATDYIDTRFGPVFRGQKRTNLVGAQASASIEFTGQPIAGETVTINTRIWTFRAALTDGVAHEVVIGADFDESASNLLAALTDGGGAGTAYSDLNNPLTGIDAALSVADASIIELTVQEEGSAGNSISAASNVTGAVVLDFDGGLDRGSQPLEFPRVNLFDGSGNAVEGLPLKLKQACAEYAVRAASASLMSDPAAPDDNTSGQVTRLKQKVGELELDTTYAENATGGNAGAGAGLVSDSAIQQYPAADLLLREYISAGPFGRVGRA
jgi:hypothetical protein